MKKIIAVIVALLLVLTLAGCSMDEPSAEDGSNAVDTYELDSEETESTDSDDDS